MNSFPDNNTYRTKIHDSNETVSITQGIRESFNKSEVW